MLPEMKIRLAEIADIDSVAAIYESAKAYMRAQGNMTQWANGYPSKSDIEADIAADNLYVGTDSDDTIVCAFAFIKGNDPTYTHIDGKWLNDAPYGTIHRIASSGRYSRILDRCVDFCVNEVENIRIDTHRDNVAMLRALARYDFKHCGVIICADGTPREAFQFTK